MKRLPKLLARTIAAVVIAAFWCISAVGTTIGTTVGVTTLATAINAATSTPAEARRWRGRGRHRRGRYRRGRGWYGGGIPTTGTVIPTVVGAGVVSGSEFGKQKERLTETDHSSLPTWT